MIVECSACSTIFPVDPLKVPTEGIHARCSVCSEVFFVSVPDSETEPPAAPAPELSEVEVAVEAEPEFGMEEEEAPLPISYDTDKPVEEPVEEPEVVFEEFEVAPVEEPAPVFEGVEATFQQADTVVEESAEEAIEEVTETLAPEEDLVVEEPEVEASGFVEEMATGYQEPTFGAMDDVGIEAPPVAAPLFGKRDPMEKAQRLARVLVSDIILYNPDRHHSATESGRVKEEFEEEIQKSWNEYVEQVGEDVANTTSYFNDALNEILAKGEQIF
jgi:predicted Zn finger-like uncharacterized protein